MKTAVFGTKPYDRQFLSDAVAAAGGRHELTFIRPRLDRETAPLAAGHAAVCAFVNDDLSAPVLETLHAGGTRHLAMRCAGYNNVDLPAAARLGVTIARVPAYSPHAVAEHAVALVLALCRRIPRAVARVREGNFELEGLLGFDLHGKTAGVVGTGQIGARAARILMGFGMTVLAHDLFPDAALADTGVRYAPLDELLATSDVITLHAPLTPDTRHMIGARTLALLKPGAMVVNTSRGALVDTAAAIDALKSGRLGSLALDVYEGEAELFFQDRSGQVLEDDVFARLLTFPNVIVTAHQAFFTKEALQGIASATLANLDGFDGGEVPPANRVG